jgi:hypothetical protein
MIKGNKIVDVRDNSVHIVECVDVYDTVTLVFTEGKKYIPFNEVREFTMDDVMLDENFVNTIKEDKKESLKEECLKILNLNLNID